VLIPIGVWHGVQNINSANSIIINIVDKAYEYEDPDHYRIPFDDPKIPYKFVVKQI
jgi:dTDP-4-dehydrorhamnose 3,5-epimerase